MIKTQDQQELYDKFISEFTDSRNNAGFHLLKMAQVIAEAKQRLSRKLFKRFLKDPRINLKRLQANKMISVYDLSKSDSRLTHFINKHGVEKSHLLSIIKDDNQRIDFVEKVIDIPFTVKQTRLAIQMINTENKEPEKAIEEVKNKAGIPKPKERKKTVPFEEYEKIKKENEQLKLKLVEFEKKRVEKPTQKNKEPELQQSFNLDYLN